MSIILDPKKAFVNIETRYLEEKSPQGYIKFTFLEGPEAYDNPDVHILNTTWNRITWEEHNNIMAQCMRPMKDDKDKIRYETDYLVFKQLKLNACLKKWDAQDDSGEIIPLNSEMIASLAPEVAEHMLKKFEEITEPNKEDLDNLEKGMQAFFDGKPAGVDAAERAWINEHMICFSYKVSPKEVRKLDYTDFLMHLRLCLTRMNIERNWSMTLQGVDTRTKAPTAAQKTGLPQGHKKGGGSIKHRQVSNVMSFNKKGGYF